MVQQTKLRLTPAHRLRGREAFARFFEESEVIRLGLCTVFRIKNDCGHFRLGITMKARGSSVERNRVRRQIRESFRQMGPKLGSYDYNIVISQGKVMSAEFANRLGEVLQKRFLGTRPEGR